MIRDFPPAPHGLAFRDPGVKVTLALSKRSVEFFKREARRHGSQYQRIIRRLVDAYALLHLEAEQRRPARSRRRTPTNSSRNSGDL